MVSGLGHPYGHRWRGAPAPGWPRQRGHPHMHRKLAALVAIIVAGAAGFTGTAAAEASLSGWTNACFGSPCTAPTAPSLQVAQHEGLLYVNATYAGSTADGTLALG